MTNYRCAAAHPEDPTPCNGPHDAVRVLGANGSYADGCEHHGARMLASVEGARAVDGSVPAASARVAMASGIIRPFPWVDGPRTEPD
ncbi:hypothetical protein [Streptomyces sp. NPDC001276]|uniref:hypothetical protein n=1 Tax=unclassified Streptomyces TaxID=2593676 RepID=UPI003696A7D5